MGKFLNMNPSMKYGWKWRDQATRISKIQKKHEKRGSGALTIELENVENPSYGDPLIFGSHGEEMAKFYFLSPFLLILLPNDQNAPPY